MNKYKIQFSKNAKDDLDEIYIYIKYKLKEPNIAKKIVKEIRDGIFKLIDFPKVNLLIDDNIIKKMELRRIIIKNYIVFYKVEDLDKEIQIVRILHIKQNWMILL